MMEKRNFVTTYRTPDIAGTQDDLVKTAAAFDDVIAAGMDDFSPATRKAINEDELTDAMEASDSSYLKFEKSSSCAPLGKNGISRCTGKR
jgi:hypothetical protein